MRYYRCSYYLMMLAVIFAPAHLDAQELSIEKQLQANYGDAHPSGFPQIKIPLVNNTELSRFGFVFVMTHHVIPMHGGAARSEWRIPGLRTCVYLDGNEDLVWIRPNTRQLVFRKESNYKETHFGWSVEIQNHVRNAELTNRNGQRWTYEKGCLKRISDRGREIDFVTDHEIIMSASRRGRGGETVVLMRAEYSDTGLLQHLELGQSGFLTFRWSDEPVLRGIEGTSEGDMTFGYDNMLLREWICNGMSTGYTWAVRGNTSKSISFGMAPMSLQSDAEYRYEYGKAGSASVFRVFKRDGNFVSETRFSSRGIFQKTPDRIIKAAYPRDGTGERLVIVSE